MTWLYFITRLCTSITSATVLLNLSELGTDVVRGVKLEAKWRFMEVNPVGVCHTCVEVHYQVTQRYNHEIKCYEDS